MHNVFTKSVNKIVLSFNDDIIQQSFKSKIRNKNKNK